MNSWYKIYTTDSYPEANIIKGMLEENSIKAILLNKQDSSYLFLGEIELYVSIHFKDVAIRLVNNILFN
jgi:putative signal transducing protein